MTTELTCTQCGTTSVAADRFCESCGTTLLPVRRVAIPAQESGQAAQYCSDCGHDTFVDEYCEVCGQRRPGIDRARGELDRIALLTDRGLEHPRNEDAAAAGIVASGPGEQPYAIAVAVCDGVSTSTLAQNAAQSASIAGVDAMLTALAGSAAARPAVLAGLAAAATAAASAGADTPDPTIAPSCTYTAAAVVPLEAGTVQIAVGNVGDSRVYWLPEPPAPAQRLTVDDSLAQELITAGVPADSEAVQAGAHTLTRWLGADSDRQPWSESSVRTIVTDSRGLLLLCTDGLWNYLPGADDIARVCAGLDTTEAATALVDYALSAGGQDNVTVVAVPVGGRYELA